MGVGQRGGAKTGNAVDDRYPLSELSMGMWGRSGCNGGGRAEQVKKKIPQIRVGRKGGGKELKGGAGITATTPHHGDCCLVILRGWPIGMLTT